MDPYTKSKDESTLRQYNENMKAAEGNISNLQSTFKAKEKGNGNSKLYEEKSKLLEESQKAS